MFSKQMRHINRYREIAAVMAKHGFGYLVEEMDFIKKIPYHERIWVKNDDDASTEIGEKIRIVLQELGPAYIKLGQIASTRPDILPNDIIVPLEKLQDKVDAFSIEQLQCIIEDELGADVCEIFNEFDTQPLATASIGQVHVATLKSGQKVAVKVQRPGIVANIETDLEILFEIAVAVQNRFGWAKKYQIVDIVEEFAKSLRKELDYTIEARNTDRVLSQSKKQTDYYIPQVYWDYSTKKILTTEFLQGIKVSQNNLLAQQGRNLSLIANRFAKGILHQIFIEGFFHGDPHPGNIVVLPKDVIGFLDFGMVGRLSSEMKNGLSALLIGLKRNNTDELLKAVLRIGIIPPDLDRRQLREDIDLYKDTYYGVPFSKISIGVAITDFFHIAQKHAIRIPSDLVIVGKALLTVEGVVKKLDPDLSLIDIVEPFGQKLLLERMEPKTIAESIWKIVGDYGDLFHGIPGIAKELSGLVDKGRLHLNVSVAETEQLLRHQAQLSNRISVSIILLAFSILMGSVFISLSLAGQATALWNNPIFEIVLIIAGVMFAWVIYGIIRSGRL